MALDEPTDNDKKFEQDGYTIVIDQRAAEIIGGITIEKHYWGLDFVTANSLF